MVMNSYTVVAGKWPGKDLTPGDVINGTKESSQPVKDVFQLVQTFSKCCLDHYSPDTEIDIGQLEQYLAFCEEWELWIRNCNSESLRFRFIFQNNGAECPLDSNKVISSPDKISEYTFEDTLNCYAEKSRYPLWGELLKDKESGELSRWYTQRIPRILSYPLTFSDKIDQSKTARVFLNVENLLGSDGTADLVRFTGLEMKTL